MRKYILGIIVFVGGAAVMILELVAAKILAAYVGASIITWSSLIGTILAALSLGYWWGGKQADKNPSYRRLSGILFISAVFICLTILFRLPILNWLQKNIKEVRLEAIFGSILLFGPASFLLAAISPYAIKLKTISLQSSGRTAGGLYALSTLGSIFGTFLVGFVLFNYLGNTKILLLVAVAILLASLLAELEKFSIKEAQKKIGLILMVVLFWSYASNYESRFRAENQIVISTAYNDITLTRSVGFAGGRPILSLTTDPFATQSAMYLDNENELYGDLGKFFRLAEHFKPGFQNSLMIGGAAYSFPKFYLHQYPEAKIDVVEIDPGMTKVAHQYFGLQDNPRLNIFHQDGRVFLNTTKNKYDVVFVDVFKTFLIPAHLTTLEAVEKIYNALNEKGVALVNIPSPIEGEGGKFLRAEYRTYKEVFPYVYVFPASFPKKGAFLQNLILVAVKDKEAPALSSDDGLLGYYLAYRWEKEIIADVPVLTDDFAPVDNYQLSAFGLLN